jgi:hypothetical protein
MGNFKSTSPVDLTAGNPINFVIYYYNNVMKVWVSDPFAGTSFTTSFNVTNLPAIVGGSNAYVGFTAGDASANSVQTVSNFVFSYTTTFTPTLTVAPGVAPGSVVISWPVGVSPLFMLQQATSLLGPCTNVNAPSQVVSAQNQVTLTPGTSTFFRLSLQP